MKPIRTAIATAFLVMKMNVEANLWSKFWKNKKETCNIWLHKWHPPGLRGLWHPARAREFQNWYNTVVSHYPRSDASHFSAMTAEPSPGNERPRTHRSCFLDSVGSHTKGPCGCPPCLENEGCISLLHDSLDTRAIPDKFSQEVHFKIYLTMETLVSL